MAPIQSCSAVTQTAINPQNRNTGSQENFWKCAKNSWIIKDKDVLQELAKKRLVSAMVSVTTFNEDLRRVMEPRTTTAKQRLKVIEELTNAGIHMGIMMGPMIPGLNEHEMQRIMKAGKDAGAKFTAYTFIRLNG